MIKISVIIPVYNSELYLEKCFNSITNQTLQEIEIIFINDGSFDNSLKILNDFSKMDLRVKVITQKNRGVSSARNIGIDNAVGEYLIFIDPDDYVDYDMLEVLYSSCKEKKYDVVIFNYIKHNLLNGSNEYKNVLTGIPLVNNNILDTIKEELIVKQENGYVWNKMYKTNIIKKNKLYFDDEITMREDLLFNLEFFKYANNAQYIEKNFYHYLIRENSAISKMHKKLFFMIKKIYNRTIQCIENYDISKNSNLIQEVNIRYSELIFNSIKSILLTDIPIKNKYEELSSALEDDIIIENRKMFKKYSKQIKCKIFYRICFSKIITYAYLVLYTKLSIMLKRGTK